MNSVFYLVRTIKTYKYLLSSIGSKGFCHIYISLANKWSCFWHNLGKQMYCICWHSCMTATAGAWWSGCGWGQAANMAEYRHWRVFQRSPWFLPDMRQHFLFILFPSLVHLLHWSRWRHQQNVLAMTSPWDIIIHMLPCSAHLTDTVIKVKRTVLNLDKHMYHIIQRQWTCHDSAGEIHQSITLI